MQELQKEKKGRKNKQEEEGFYIMREKSTKKRNDGRATEREKDSKREEKKVEEPIFHLNKKPGVRMSRIVSRSLVIMSLFLPRTTCLM